ncbi:ECF RNA polymerase sigma factor SigE [Stieleria varia]|uniref:ECF RNA polymerase sigma factor SigE n=1 Tax=Stieleria varia TaxID=2528005 RepID=A0A5C6B8N1_9BACT|nr:ECF RNA polymerase sigma factor SigE [Stieleria varia]
MQSASSNDRSEPPDQSADKSEPNDTAHSQPDPLVLERLRIEPAAVLADAFAAEHDRLWQLAMFRMDHRIAGRVDADDVLQESFLAAEKRVQHYLKSPKCSLFVWLRMIVTQTLVDIHRRHFGADMRSAAREVSFGGPQLPESTCVSIVRQLTGSQTSPSGVMMREESTMALEKAISEMPALDQETIALRHFEGLSNSETAEVLGISVTAASNRYVRALARLRDILEAWENSDKNKPAGDDAPHSTH